MLKRLRDYALLVRLHRPIGVLLLLWPTLWALWIAGEGHPDPWIATVFVLGVVLMRSAGCAINDYADRDFDPYVERTKDRPLAAGRIGRREAIGVFVALSLVAFVLVLTLNPLTIALSFAGALLAASYPFMKRITHLPQVYLGAAFGWGIPMAFAAQTGAVPVVAWVLFAANVFWTLAYDTEYAMVDRDDDLRVGVKSSAILFASLDRHMVAAAHALALALLVLAGYIVDLGILYYMGLAAAAGTAVYQQGLIRDRGREACFRAFVNNNGFGAAVFAGLALDYFSTNFGRSL